MKIGTWFLVLLAIVVALLGNFIAATWARQDNLFSLWFFALVLIAPFVFITFGLVTSRLSVAIGAGTIDSLLSIGTILIGLVFFNEWSTLTIMQYFGIIFVVCGLIMMQHKRTTRYPRAHTHQLLKVFLTIMTTGALRLTTDKKKR